MAKIAKLIGQAWAFVQSPFFDLGLAPLYHVTEMVKFGNYPPPITVKNLQSFEDVQTRYAAKKHFVTNTLE